MLNAWKIIIVSEEREKNRKKPPLISGFDNLCVCAHIKTQFKKELVSFKQY